MKNKKWLISFLTTVACLTGLYACAGVEDSSSSPSASVPPIVAPEVEKLPISETKVDLDLYDRITLSVEGATSTLTWSSSNTSVATVSQNGEVEAISVGTAVITVTDGELSATCEVNVYNSNSAPVLTVDRSEITVGKGSDITINASVLWKGKPYEGATYTWAFVQGAAENVITLTTDTENTATAVVSGVEYGETQLIVSTTVYNQTVSKIVSVACLNADVRFDCALNEHLRLENGKYVLGLGLTNVEEHVASKTPVVSIYNKGTLLESVSPTWSSSNTAVATVGADGYIQAVDCGEAVIRGEYEGNAIQIFVTVYRPELKKSLADLGTFDMSKDDTLTLKTNTAIDGELVFLKLGDYVVENESVTVDYQTGEIVLPKAAFAKTFGEKDVVAYFENKQGDKVLSSTTVSSHVVVAAKVVYTIEDWLAMREYVQNTDSTGYFVQGADLNFGKSDTYNYSDTTYAVGVTKDKPFKGTYDGNGYIIENVWMGHYQNGLFGFVDGATIQNLTVLNGKNGTSAACANGFVFNGTASAVSNVYVHLLEQRGYVFAGATSNYSNTFVKIDKETHLENENKLTIHKYPTNRTAYVQVGGDNHWGNGVDTGNYTYYATEEAAKSFDFKSWLGDFYLLLNGVVYPKGAMRATLSAPASTAVNTTLEVETGSNCILTLDENALAWGLKISENVITIPNDNSLYGKSFTITATNKYDDTMQKSVVVKIIEQKVIKADSLGDVVLNEGTTVSIDAKGAIDGELISAKIGNVTLLTDNVSVNAQGVITLEKSDLIANIWGEQTVEFVFHKTVNGNLVLVTTVTAAGVFVTDVLETTSDLKTAYKYVRGDGTEVPCLNGGGYFILGKDIIFEDASNVNFMNAESWGTAAVKFNGTLDGRGHKIDGMYVQIYNNGLLGASTSATLKNIIFTNGRTTRNTDGGSNAFLLSSYEVNGVVPTLKNVYVHMALQSCVVVGRNGVNTDNVMFVIDDLGGYEYKVYNQDAHLLTLETVKIGGTANEPKVTRYADLSEAKAHDYTKWDTSFWLIHEGVAYPKSFAKAELKGAPTQAYTGTSFTVEAKDCRLSLNAEAIAAGITILDGVVTLPAMTTLESFTITATSIYDSTVFTSVTVKIVVRSQDPWIQDEYENK